MTDKTWKQIIKRWKNYYRDDRIDQHISDIYFDDLKFYDDRIALEAADEVMRRLQTFGKQIPQLPAIRSIFNEVRDRHQPKQTYEDFEDSYNLDNDPPMNDWTKIVLEYLKESVKDQNKEIIFSRITNQIMDHKKKYGWSTSKYIELIETWNENIVNQVKEEIETDPSDFVPF